MKSERQDAIRQYLYAQGPTKVGALAEALHTSVATLRRDLVALEDEGVVTRLRGGAALTEGPTVEVAFKSRERLNLKAKRAIADRAYDLIGAHTACFFDSSTTILQLARRLKLDPIPITVFTNGLSIAQLLLGVGRVKVVLLGGQLRHENASIVGPEAMNMVERLWFDQLFLGVGAVGDDGFVYGIDMAEASLNTATAKRSSSRYLLADSSKFSQRATYAVVQLGPDTHVITDDGIGRDWRERLSQWGAPFTVADSAPRLDGKRP